MKWRVCCMNCRSRLSPAAQMGDFVGFRGGRRGAISGDDFGNSVRGGLLSGMRWAGSGCAMCGGGNEKKVHPTRKVQSDEPKIENMDGCLTKSEHGVGASSALMPRLCRGTAARRGVVVWTMAEERRRATARWWIFGRKRGRLTGWDYCLLAYGLYRLA